MVTIPDLQLASKRYSNVCEICKKEFPSNRKRRYCSRKCAAIGVGRQARAAGYKAKCYSCGEQFKSTSQFGYCSPECRKRGSDPEHRLSATINCAGCGTSFSTFSQKAMYCPNCKVQTAMKRRKAYLAEYQRTHREQWKVYKKNSRDRLLELWHGGAAPQYRSHASAYVIRSEEFIANLIATQGFTDIVHASRTISNYFPADILARKDGQIILVEVTTSLSKNTFPYLWALADFLHAKLIVYHVKPDLSWWIAKERTHGTTYSSCIDEFREHIAETKSNKALVRD